MSVLDALRRVNPRLSDILSRRAREVAAPSALAPAARALELREARSVLDGLARRGVTSLRLAGGQALTDRLLESGALDEFTILGLHASGPVGERYLPGRGFVPVRPLSEAAAGPGQAVLLLDPALAADLPTGTPFSSLAPLNPAAVPWSIPEAYAAGWRSGQDERLARCLDRLARAGRGRRGVLFAGIFLYFNANKLSLALRERGLATALLCLNPGNTAFRQDHFDLVLDAGGDLELFYRIIAASPLDLTHFQGWLNLHCFAASAAALSRAPLVVEFNDMPGMLFHREEYDRLFGPGSFEDDAWSVEQCLARCRGAVVNHDDIVAALGDRPDLPPALSFHSYPLAEFFAPEPADAGSPLSVVFAGTVNPSNYPARAFGDVQLLGLIERLTAQGVAFHLFPNPYQSFAPRGAFWDYEYLAALRPNFVIHPGASPDVLPAQMAGLGYGCMLYLFPEAFSVRADSHLRHIMPTKFFSYLEAGLPVLVSRELGAVARVVRENRLGLCLGQEDLPRLADILRGADFAALRRNVLAYRERMRLSGQVDRLIAWYDALPTGAP